MRIKSKSGKVLIELPTQEEDAAINAGIAADPDTYEVPPEDFPKLRRLGRPISQAPHKISTTIRFDPEVIAAFKATGKGWQSRMNAALKEWLAEHPNAA